jgi:hypothetical protein
MSGGVKYIQRTVVNAAMTGTLTVVAMIHIFLIHVYYDTAILNYCIVCLIFPLFLNFFTI